MKRSIRFFLASCLGLMQVLAGADEPPLPSGTVHLIVPFSAGGVADVLARVVAERWHAALPQGVIVENRIGAGGNIGAADVFGAKPNGETLLVSSPGPIAVNQGLYPKLSFDPIEWAPVAVLATVPNALIVSPTLPVRSATEFIAYVKAHPGQVSYATQGNGTTSHLTAKLFESLAGAQMINVPYKGDAPALTDLSGGHVDAFFGNLGASLALHKSGKIRILAVADSHRAEALPDVPTFAEIGMPAMQSITWYAMVAPPATSLAIRTRLNALVSQALADPATRLKLHELGLEPATAGVAQTATFLNTETARWQKVILDAKIKLD